MDIKNARVSGGYFANSDLTTTSRTDKTVKVSEIAKDLADKIFIDTLNETNDFTFSTNMYVKTYYTIINEFMQINGITDSLPDISEARDTLEQVNDYLMEVGQTREVVPETVSRTDDTSEQTTSEAPVIRPIA